MKRPRRKTLIVAALAFLGLSFGVWAAIYAYDKGFTRRWRTLIKEEFAAHGIEATIGKLTIDPLEGLVARDLRVYEDKDHERLLASISQMALDIDSARVAKGELFINELTIADADVWLPLDPEDKSAGRVEIRRVNARILLPEDRIEFRSAEGDLYGINVSLAGSVFQPKRAKNGEESDPKPPQPGEKVARALKGWDLTPEAVEAIKGVVRVLKRMEYERGSQPRLDLELYGDLAERKDLRAIARLSSGPFRYEGWRCGEFDALAEFDAGRFGIRHLTAKDEAGEFKGSAELSADGRAATVRFRSTIDLPRLIREAMDEPRLGEVIFYEPPDITAEGTVDLNGAWKPDDWPVKLIGRVDARKFLTRGIVFDAFRADFSAAGRRFFLRNAALEHDSGGATGQALYDGESLRFEAKARMDPSAFAPFAAGSRLGTLLADLEAGSDSTFRIDLRGGGTGPLGTAPIAADGEFDLRDFSLGDYQIGRLEAKLRLAPGEIALDHPYAELPEGTARAARLAYREADDTLAIDRWEAEVFPADFMRPMNPELAAEIARVDFGVHPPLSRGSGLLSLDDRGPDRISATFMAQNRTLIHGGAEPLALDGFEAAIDLDGVALGIAARGQALGGAIAAEGDFILSRGRGFPYTATLAITGANPEEALALSRRPKAFGTGGLGAEGIGRAKFDAETRVRGWWLDPGSAEASGTAVFKSATLESVPWFGAAVPLLTAAFPDQSEAPPPWVAEAEFSAAEGGARIEIASLKARSGAVTLAGRGGVDRRGGSVSLVLSAEKAGSPLTADLPRGDPGSQERASPGAEAPPPPDPAVATATTVAPLRYEFAAAGTPETPGWIAVGLPAGPVPRAVLADPATAPDAASLKSLPPTGIELGEGAAEFAPPPPEPEKERRPFKNR